MEEKIVLRPSQEEVLKYRQGLMGISAVPGSGKTFTLSNLAVKLILTTPLEEDQEVLVVTFSNSAADNFSTRIGEKLRASGLLEGFGYRVRTLHGLANDIIRERPELVGLSTDFGIIDEAEFIEILKDLVSQAKQENIDFLRDLISEDFNDKKREEFLHKPMDDLLRNLTIQFIKTVKDQHIRISDLEDWLADGHQNEFLPICLSIYRSYQAALNYRGAIDFDDLIRYAYECLSLDKTLTQQLRHRWPIILEDEAQDSSKLQQEILEILVGETGNWVRVGDPNQAIYESFTTADPNLLKSFVAREDVRSVDLPVSGRSAPAIIDLANELIDWVQNEHPNFSVRDALSEPFIQPTLEGDPQQNPEDFPGNVEVIKQAMTPEQELTFLSKSIQTWLEENPESTVAVLTFINKRASDIINHIKLNKIPVSDALMKVPEETRTSAGAIALILKSILDPTSPTHLATAFEVFNRHFSVDEEINKTIKLTSKLIKRIENTEDFLYPSDNSWQKAFSEENLSEFQLELLDSFRTAIVRWHAAAILPLDQLVLIVGQDLVLESSEIAIIHKLAGFISSLRDNNPHWTVIDILNQFIAISKNDRGFATFSQKEEGFNPDSYRGQVIVATVHKSKGLEWDKVFLSSANNYDYPSGDPSDSFTAEKYFIEGRRNLEAELLYDLEALKIENSGGIMFRQYDRQNARDDIVRDRLRLFYVGVTRAKKSLTISWNTGKMNNLKASLPVLHLADFLEESGGND